MALNKQFAIKDDKFEVSDLHDYTLILEIGIGSIHLNVLDFQNQRLLSTEEHSVSRNPGTQDIINALDELYASHHFMAAGFWREVFVSVNNLKHALIPESLYDEEHALELLQPLVTVNEKEDQLFGFHHPNLSLRNVYLVRKQLIDWFEDHYANATIQFVHFADILLNSLLRMDKSPERKVALVVGKEKFSVCITQGEQLLYFNSFVYNLVNDFVYYVLYVVRELGLDRESDPFYLYGEIMQDSILFEKLAQYITKLELGKRPDWLSYSYHFDELRDQQFLKFGGMKNTVKA